MHNKGFLHHQIWRNEQYEVQEICLNLTHPDVFTYIKSFSRLHGHLIAWKLVILNALTLQAYSSEAELSTRPKKIFKNDEHQFFNENLVGHFVDAWIVRVAWSDVWSIFTVRPVNGPHWTRRRISTSFSWIYFYVV